MKLYGYWRSSCSYRVRIALGIKGLAVEHVAVHLLEDGGRQNAPEFAKKNPSRQVPVLELDDGTALGQSIAILEYLEETHPEPALLPQDAVLRARCRQLTEIVNAGTQPLQNLYVMQMLQERGVDQVAWTVHHIRRGLEAYDAVANETAGGFSVGDTPTFADCALIPQLYNARRFKIDVASDFPLLQRIDENAQKHPAFFAAHPDQQPDAA